MLAASMFGLFELQLPNAWANKMAGMNVGRRRSLGGAAGMGFLSALIVGPFVTAPRAAALLYITQTGDTFLDAAALFALGLGQGTPLIAFGTVGSRALPRAGAWMVQVKYVFGFVFLEAAIWMTGRVLPPPATLALWAILLLTAAVFVGVVDRLTVDADAGPWPRNPSTQPSRENGVELRCDGLPQRKRAGEERKCGLGLDSFIHLPDMRAIIGMTTGEGEPCI